MCKAEVTAWRRRVAISCCISRRSPGVSRGLLTNRLKKRRSSARRIRFTEVPHVVEFRHVPTAALPLTSVGSVQNMITDERFSSSQNRA